MLKLAKDEALTDIISDGDGSNPLETQHPIEGSTVETEVYLFNDDATKRYEGVTVYPTGDDSSWIEVAEEGGSFGSSLDVPDIDDVNTGYKILVRVTTPQVQDTQNKTDIKLTVDYTEFAV